VFYMTSQINSYSSKDVYLSTLPSLPGSYDEDELSRTVSGKVNSSPEYNLKIRSIKICLERGDDLSKNMLKNNGLCLQNSIQNYALESADTLVVKLFFERGHNSVKSLSEQGEKRVFRAYKILTFQRELLKRQMVVSIRDGQSGSYPGVLLQMILDYYLPDYSQKLAECETAVYRHAPCKTSSGLVQEDSSVAELLLPYEPGKHAKGYLDFSADSNEIDYLSYTLMEDLIDYRMNLKNQVLRMFCHDDVAKKNISA
jgi:hypothetical protein